MKQIEAIVLAAGLSRRMGEPKLLLPWRGGTVLDATLANVLASNIRGVTIVTGGYQAQVDAVLQPYTLPLDSLQRNETTPSIIVNVVHNPEFATGEMLSSLKVGINALGPSVDGCIVMLGDMPLILPETINRVVAALQTHNLVAPTFEGKRGHPVGFGRSFFLPLLNLPANGTPRDVIHANRHQLHQVELDSQSILIDLDTREAYERWKPTHT